MAIAAISEYLAYGEVFEAVESAKAETSGSMSGTRALAVRITRAVA